MQLRFWRILLFILCGNNLFSVTASDLHLKFSSYSLEQGLTNSLVTSLYKDTNELLWVGTEHGLNLFTGTTFIPLEEFTNHAHQLNSAIITAITQNADGEFIIGTWGDGLFTYDAPNGQVVQFLNMRDSNESITDNYVNTIFRSTDHQTWIGTVYGLSLFTEDDNFIQFTFEDLSLNNEPSIKEIVQIDQHELLLFTNFGEFILLNTNTYKYSKIFEIPEFIQGVNTVLQTGDYLLIGTENKGIYKFNLKERTIRKSDISQTTNLTVPVRKLIKTKNNEILIATDGNGILEYKNGNLIHYDQTQMPDHSRPNNDQLQTLYIDDSDILWAGYYKGGLSKSLLKNNGIIHEFKHKNCQPCLPNNIINCFALTDDSTVWIGTEKGLAIYDSHQQQLSIPSAFQKRIITQIGRQPITSLSFIKDNLFVGTYQNGFFQIDFRTNTLKNYNTHNSGLESNFIKSISAIDSNTLLIATLEGGIHLFDWKTIKQFPLTCGLGDGIFDFFHTLKTDSATVWLSTAGNGPICLNLNNGTKKYSKCLNSAICYFTFLDNKNNLWTGTNRGLYIWSSAKDDFIPMDNALNDLEIYAMTDMGKSHLWITTNQGIYNYNFTTTLLHHLSAENIQSSEFQPGAILKLNNEQFIAGGINGYNVITTQSVFKTKNNARIFISDIEIQNKKAQINQRYYDQKILPRHPDFLTEICIPSQINFFKLKPVIIDYLHTNQLKFAYTIESEKTEAPELYTETGDISFHNLRFGTYNLRIFPIDTYTGQPLYEKGKAIRIVKMTPWWHSTTFIITAILSTLIILALLRHIHNRKQKRIQQQLRFLVEEKTAHLHQKQKKITNQRDKLQSQVEEITKLEDTKEALINMIVHDLKNPLNTIMCLSSLGASEYDAPIYSTGNQMLNLVENILDVRKYEKQNIQLHREPVNLKTLSDEAIHDVEFHLNNANLSIINQLTSHTLSADAQIIKRIFINLLTNAIKFSPNNGTITLTSEITQTDNKQYVLFSVTDQGRGVPPEYHENIFDIYSQVIAKKCGLAYSNGIGLSFCKIAIEAHGGKIWVDSAYKEGARFIVSLPL
ncbi:hypothetical protein DMA11_05210 [Marinilabiliaceae bacterium JC017]|nr:hypothetical protein DMA11_05210 [Marinilabiliaceae bacterium JC017]